MPLISPAQLFDDVMPLDLDQWFRLYFLHPSTPKYF